MIRNKTAILVLLTGLNLLNYIDRFVVSAVLKKIQGPGSEGGLELSNLEGGLLATAFLLGYFVTSPWFGARADRGARKGLIALGVGVWSLATVASGLATGVGSMLVARVFVGVGEAAYATLAPTIIDDITPPEKKGKALAVFYVAAPVGSALGYLIGGFIEARWGWRTAFFVAGPPGMMLALACLLIKEPERKLREAKGGARQALRTLAKIPLFRRAVLGYCAYTGAVGAFAYWAPKYLAEKFGDVSNGLAKLANLGPAANALISNLWHPDQLVASLANSGAKVPVLHGILDGVLTNETADYYFGVVTVVAGATGTIVGGRLADRANLRFPTTPDTAYDASENRRGLNALLRVCAIGMCIAAPMTAVAFALPTPVGFFAAAFFAEIGLFLSTSPVNAIGLRAVPPELRASAMAAMIFAIHLLGDLWSPSVLGLLTDLLPATIAMMAVPLTFALSASVWWPRVREANA